MAVKFRAFKKALMKCFDVRMIVMNGELHVFYVTDGKDCHDEVLGPIDNLADYELEARFDRWLSQKVDPVVLENFSRLGELLAGSRWSFSLLNEYYATLEYNHRGDVTEQIYGDVRFMVAVTAEGVLEFVDFINELPLYENLACLDRLKAYTTFVKG